AAGEDHALDPRGAGRLEDVVDADDVGREQVAHGVVHVVGGGGQVDQGGDAGQRPLARDWVGDVADDGIGQPRRRDAVEAAHGEALGGEFADCRLTDTAAGTGDEDQLG